jgi:hypothetical protein
MTIILVGLSIKIKIEILADCQFNLQLAKNRDQKSIVSDQMPEFRCQQVIGNIKIVRNISNMFK